MKRSDFLILRAFYTVVSKRNFVEIALIVDAPFVETLLVLADKLPHITLHYSKFP